MESPGRASPIAFSRQLALPSPNCSVRRLLAGAGVESNVTEAVSGSVVVPLPSVTVAENVVGTVSAVELRAVTT
ncbi:hypothetical protein D7Y15_13655 [Corallococcus sp. AB030]|nr:hypothetical protein D7V77_09140 [Corallococcus sp. CA041A]RKI15482.1 hypothetical protein D7Y15_13655 [Corallococcus sp. AB030]